MKNNHISHSTQAPERVGLFLLISFTACAVESGLLYLTFLSKIPLLPFIAVHAALILFLLSLLYLANARQQDTRFLALAGLMISLLGPLGAFICLIIGLLYSILSRYALPIPEFLAQLSPDIRKDESTILYERLIYGMEDFDSKENAVSFQDIMTYGSVLQKLTAIDRMLKHYKPSFASILFHALKDKSHIVRSQTAASIATLDTRYFGKYLKLKEKLEKRPDDPELNLAIGNYCEKYIASNILEKDRADKMKRNAIAAYETYLSSYPDKQHIQIALGRLNLSNGNLEEGRSWLEPVVKNLVQNPPSYENADQENNQHKLQREEAYSLWLDLLFARKDYDGIRTFAAQLLANKESGNAKYNKLYESSLLWAKGYEEALAEVEG
jgi:hypothetical protein